jgi:hypothetical protein
MSGMRLRLEPAERPLHWIGSSKRDLLNIPGAVVREIGVASSVARLGSKHTTTLLSKEVPERSSHGENRCRVG